MSHVELDVQTDPPNRPTPVRVLALSGGGYRGLFTADVLARLEQATSRKASELIDLVVGTSAGALIAAGISLGVPAEEIRKAFVKHGPLIFPRSRLNTAKQLFVNAPYSAEPLLNAITELLGENANQPIRLIPANLIVVAVSQTHSQARIYGAGRFARGAQDNLSLKEAIAASAAAPTYFPPRRPDAETLVDGGLVANAPELVGVGAVHTVLGTPLDRIRVVSIGTAAPASGQAALTPASYSFVSWMRPSRNLLLLTLDAQEHLGITLALQLLDERYVRIDAKPSPAQAKIMGMIDCANEKATKTLAALAQSAWDEHGTKALALLTD